MIYSDSSVSIARSCGWTLGSLLAGTFTVGEGRVGPLVSNHRIDTY